MVGIDRDITLLARMADPALHSKNRMRQIGMLARHFRIPPDYWDDKEVRELDGWYEEMVAMAGEERQSVEVD